MLIITANTPIAVDFFQTFWDFSIRRNLIYFLITPLSGEFYSWKIKNINENITSYGNYNWTYRVRLQYTLSPNLPKRLDRFNWNLNWNSVGIKKRPIRVFMMQKAHHTFAAYYLFSIQPHTLRVSSRLYGRWWHLLDLGFTQLAFTELYILQSTSCLHGVLIEVSLKLSLQTFTNEAMLYCTVDILELNFW